MLLECLLNIIMKIGISSRMLAESININDKFLEEKETKLGKKITE